MIQYVANMWYTIYRIGKVNVMKEMGVLDARNLAYYIMEKCNFNISPIKLQKSLYFCFAYWGGFIRKGKKSKSEIIASDYNEYLFTNKIEAWVYGPVIPDVYHEKDLFKFKINADDIFKDTFIKEFIDGVLEDTLSSSDFKLVEVSHEDKCWKKNFKKNALFHNGIIPFEEIITEYASKY